MVGMSQEQSALFWQSLTWKFVLGSGLVKESICHTSPSLLQTLGETCRRIGVSACRTSEARSRMRVGLCVWKTRLPCVWRVGLRSGATGVARLENRSCARGGRVALPRDRHCMYTEHEQAQNRPTLRVSRAAGHISESKLAETCNAGCAGAQPYQTRGERVSEVRFADTPKRQHAQTPTRRYVSACEAPALSAIYR
jgi:hypothetical protein